MDGEKNLSTQSYLPSLSKLSSQINWLTFAILIIMGTNTFLLYRFHFGALEAYKSRARDHAANQNALISQYIKTHTEHASFAGAANGSMANNSNAAANANPRVNASTTTTTNTAPSGHRSANAHRATNANGATNATGATNVNGAPSTNEAISANRTANLLIRPRTLIRRRIANAAANTNQATNTNASANDNTTANPSTAATANRTAEAAKIVESYTSGNNELFGYIEQQTSVITIPILGIPLFERDFFILYLILGLIFLLWLFTLLKYAKNFLENLLNEFHYPSDSDANTIQSLFFLIMPGDYTSKRYAYYELVFLLFISSIVLLVISDTWDIFFRPHPIFGSLNQDPYFRDLAPHLAAAYIIVASCLAASVVWYRNGKSTLKHIRNTLILLRWNRTAFFPVLYEFANNKNKPLGEKRNFIEYRACDDSNDSKLVILLTHEDSKAHEVKAAVDLPHSIRRFYDRYGASGTEYDEKLQRPLTLEESFMRRYFRKILTDSSYEPDLYNEISKII